MDISKGSIYELLNGKYQFVVPVYQRKYSWLKDVQCDRLWKDIVNMEKQSKRHHFVGSIVTISDVNVPMGIHRYQIIDGQQRVTTLTILMIALRDHLREASSEEVDEDTLTYYLLKNDHQKGYDRYKLLLNDNDREVLIKLIDVCPIIEDTQSNILNNYIYFKEKIAGNELTPAQIYNSIAKLQIVNITLKREEGDDPQLIFESLNSTGMDLSESDLIRNYILMGMTNDEQKDIYVNYWQPMENAFPVEKRSELMDKFFRDYLTMKLASIPNKEQVYDSFKSYCINTGVSNNTKELAEDLFFYAQCYNEISANTCSDPELHAIFIDIRIVKMEVAYPLLLKVYGDYKNNVISKADFIAILRLTESYVVRRAVCEIPTSSLNKTFATMRNNIKIDDYLNSIKVAFLSLETYKRFPTDEEFKRKLQIKDIYTMRSINYILVKLENYNNKEPISFTGFTIEHIMPQNDNLKPDWVSALGENWKEDHKTYLHRLGNLTLTKYNSEMGDRPFSEKLLVLKQSATHTLNKYVVEQNIWNIDTIEERTKQLCDYSIDIWKFPAVSQEIISTYLKQSEEPTTKYSIDNYDFSNVFVKMLYTKLDEAIMALNPSIKREFKKLYIAYKYRTNFVDIIIQKTRLRLTINMDFDGVNDPCGICRNVTDIGRWGNGDVEISFDSLSLLNQTIDIIKQSLNKQI